MTRSHRKLYFQAEDCSNDHSILHDSNKFVLMLLNKLEESLVDHLGFINGKEAEDDMKSSLMSATKELKRLNAKYNEIRTRYSF